MHSFLQHRRSVGAFHDASKGIRFRDSPCYYEFEIPLDDGSFGRVYVFQRSEHSYLVCACMPDEVASAIDSYADRDTRDQRAAFPVYRDAWPLLMALHAKGSEQVYSPAALVILTDPDDAGHRWVVATEVGNLFPVGVADVLAEVRLVEAMHGLVGTCEAVIEQVRTSSLDLDRLAQSLMRSGLSGAIARVGSFFDRNAAPMVDLFEFFAKKDA